MGSELLVSINASPFSKGKMGQRCAIVSSCEGCKAAVVFVNLVGGNDGLFSTGPAAGANGESFSGAPFEEFIGTVDLDCGVAHDCLPGDNIETIHSRSCLVSATRRERTV